MNNFDDIPVITQPKNLQINLYKHQLASVYEMEKREKELKVKGNTQNTIIETNIGVNADITGYGKCHAINTPILMYDGSIKLVQDIKNGDLVMGDDSTKRTVLNTVCGEEKLYKICQNNGDDYIVNFNHILSLKIIRHKYIISKPNNYTCVLFDKQLLNYKVKQFKTFDNAKEFLSNYDIDPYLNISVKNYLKLSPNIKKLLKGYKAKVEFPEINLNENPYDIPLNSIEKQHIVNSKKNRLQLLAGIVDKIATNRQIYLEICIFNLKLKDNILFLARSLGFHTKTTRNIKKCNNNYKIYYRIYISNNLHLIPSRKFKFPKLVNKDILSDINIIPLNVGKYYGFNVDSNHKYLMGDFTVTHNSLSYVALVLRDKMEWDLNTPYNHIINYEKSGGRIRVKKIKTYTKIPCTLILVSQSIVKQWKDEFNYTKLNVKTVTTRKETQNVNPFEHNVIIVTPTMFNNLITRFQNMAWKRFIFDEPSHIRVPAMKNIMAGFYWFITATPNLIIKQHCQCSTSFMCEILSGANTYWYDFETLFAPNIIKNNPEFVKKSYKMPKTINKYYSCYQPLFSTIKGFVNETILTMVSAGNISGAIKCLGGTNTNNIIELIQRKKSEEIEEINAKISIYTIRNDNERLNKWKKKKDEIMCQLNDLKLRINETLKDNCCICYGEYNSPTMISCKHIFCGECLLKWMSTNTTCPICRKDIEKNSMICINSSEEIKENIPKTKNQTILEIINSKKNGKYIIFSNYNETFDSIRELLKSNNILYAELKRTTQFRIKTLENFKNGNISVIFLNSTYNGSGINLQDCTDIILYHYMSENIETQILGRANRIGRNIPLTVHYLQN